MEHLQPLQSAIQEFFRALHIIFAELFAEHQCDG